METVFSDMLQDLVAQSGIGKNELIRISGLERSNFFKFLRGDRVPSREQYLQIIGTLQLSEQKREELDREFMKVTIGEKRFKNRQLVLEGLKILSTTVEEEKVRYPQFSVERSSDDYQPVYRGKDAVRHMIQIALNLEFDKSCPSFEFYVPGNADFFFSVLKAKFLYRGVQKTSIRQLVQFPSEKRANNTSYVKAFNNILPLIMSAPEGYEVSCYYARTEVQENKGVIFPFYLIDEERLLLFNSDFSCSIIIKDLPIIQGAHEEFLRFFNSAKPLLYSFHSLEKLYSLMKKGDWGGRIVDYETIPCACHLATDELIQQFLPESLWKSVSQHITHVQADKDGIEFLSFSGLKKFVEDGILEELPPGILPGIPLRLRMFVLKKIRERLGTHYFLINEEKLPAMKAWHVQTYPGYGLILMKYNSLDTVLIEEENVLDAYEDFFLSLFDTRMVLSSVEAEEKLQELMQQLAVQQSAEPEFL